VSSVTAAGALVAQTRYASSYKLFFVVPPGSPRSFSGNEWPEEIEALILSVRVDDKGNHHHGIEFQELPPNERMILRSLVYQQMIENPRSVV